MGTGKGDELEPNDTSTTPLPDFSLETFLLPQSVTGVRYHLWLRGGACDKVSASQRMALLWPW